MPDVLLEAVSLKSDFIPTEITIDQQGLVDAIKAHYVKAMEKAENKLISIMKKEIKKTTYGKAPGKPKWRKEISTLLQEVYREVADNYVEFGVGIPDDVAYNTFVKAMIIAYGNGFMGYGNATGGYSSGSITAGPTGRSVWDDDMNGKHPSKAKSVYEIPQFNQEGNHFIYNSMLQMQKHFDDVLADASKSLSDAVFYKHVIVHKGA